MVQLEPKPETRATVPDIAVPAVAVLKHQSNAATTAAPTASDAPRRLRAPRRAPANRAFLLTGQPEQLPPVTESSRAAVADDASAVGLCPLDPQKVMPAMPACDPFSMRPSELLKLLQQARDDFGCVGVALRCDCENLETVYVTDRCGELAVTDRGETFQYLDLSRDRAYAKVDVERARAICLEHGVELHKCDDENYPEVIQVVGDQTIRAAIEAVSGAVDELFLVALGRRRTRGE